jgi:uncharacterized protein
MSLSLYDITVPVMIQGMNHASAVLERGRTFASQKGLSDEAVLEARLASDMMTLMGQIQRASDTAKLTAVRIGQVSSVPMADTETTFNEAQTRIAATIGFLRSVPASAFDGRDDAEIVLPVPTGRRVYSARNYVLEFALPNFFFHVTTAYGLLRSLGVPVGKRHFLGWE